MRLLDLDPRWLLKDGQRIGILFRTPKPARPNSGHFYQTCFFRATSWKDQREAVWAVADDLKRESQQHFGDWQGCNESIGWTVTGDSFATLSITPSIDGSRGGLWHGYITNGQIVGGV